MILKEHVFVEFLERFQLIWSKGFPIFIFHLLTVFGLVQDKNVFIKTFIVSIFNNVSGKTNKI